MKMNQNLPTEHEVINNNHCYMISDIMKFKNCWIILEFIYDEAFIYLQYFYHFASKVLSYSHRPYILLRLALKCPSLSPYRMPFGGLLWPWWDMKNIYFLCSTNSFWIKISQIWFFRFLNFFIANWFRPPLVTGTWGIMRQKYGVEVVSDEIFHTFLFVSYDFIKKTKSSYQFLLSSRWKVWMKVVFKNLSSFLLVS